MWQLVGVTSEIVVEGHDKTGDAGSFRGRVLAVAIDGGSPAAGDAPDAASTWFLVADDRKDAPVWVAMRDVAAQRLGR